MHMANRLFFLICTLFVIAPSDQSQNVENLSQFIEKLQTLARLTNGIILEVDLMKGSIPSDDVISELLHMGSVSIDDLLKLDSNQLNDTFHMYHNLSQLATSDEIEFVEARFNFLDDIRKEVVQLEDLKNLPGHKEYQTSVTQLNSVKIDENILKTIFSNLDQLEEQIKNVSSMKLADPKKPADVEKQVTDVQEMVKSLEALSADITKFNKILTELATLKSFATVETSFLDPLKKELEVRQKYITGSSSGAKINFKLIENNVEQWLNSSIVFESSKDMVGPIQKLIESRIDIQKWTRIFSPGFSSGLENFPNLPIDAKNEYLKVLFSESDSDWVSEHLSKSLIPITEFGKNVSEQEELWKLLSSQNSLDVLKMVVTSLEELAKHASQKDAVLAKMKEFEKCDHFSENPKSKAQTLDAIDKLNAAVDDLKSAFLGFESFDYLKTPPDFKQLARYKKLAVLKQTDLDSLKSVISSSLTVITTLKEDFPEFKTNISQLTVVIKNVNPLPIGQHLKSLEVSGYLGFYSCLKDNIGSKAEDGKIVVDFLNELSEFRKNAPNSKSQEALDVVGSVLNSLDNLKDLKKYGNEMKNIVDTEAVALKNSKFDDSQNELKKLVKSIEGLVKIKEFSEKKKELEALLDDLSPIRTSAESNKAKLKTEEYESVAKVESLKTVLSEALLKIEELNQKIDKLEAKEFESFATILEAANEIPDVTEDVKSLVSALNALSAIDPAIQNKVTEIVKSSSFLESLDMKFSTYEISSGIDALKFLDIFFSSFKQNIPPPPTDPPTSTVLVTTTESPKTIQSTSIPVALPSSPLALKETTSSTAKAMPEWQIGLIVALCLIVVAAVILGILSYCRGWLCFKKKTAKSSYSSSSENDIVTILAPVGPVPAEQSLYIPPPSMYHPAPSAPPPPPQPAKPKSVSMNVATAQQGPNDFPQAEWTVEPTQENEPKAKTVEDTPKSKEGGTGSKESTSKGSTSKSKEDIKMKPSQEVM